MGGLLVLLLLAGPGAGLRADDGPSSDLPRHPLELRALVAPEEVRAELPEAIARAEAARDERLVALLRLAEANACRVTADWVCQRRASAEASAAARAAGDALLAARGMVLESRALMPLQDYTRAEELLAEAQSSLQQAPSAELSADIELAFSSLSHSLGKHALSAEYAERGLALLASGQAQPLQARLQRNRARALAQLDELEAAQDALEAGIAAVAAVDDPKLTAELHLESARLAHRRGDQAGQRRHAAEVLALADRLRNSQLYGQAREALGLTLQQAGDPTAARSELEAAVASFQSLGLERDELRAGQGLIGAMLELRADPAALDPVVRRHFELQSRVALGDRAQAADDFEARLEYLRQQIEIDQLEDDARMASERAASLATQQRLGQWVTALALLSVLVLAAFFVHQRRANRRLERALRDLRLSEARASELLRLSSGLVFLHDLDGRVEVLNPAAAQALMVAVERSAGIRLGDHVASADHEALTTYLETLRSRGEASQVLRITSAEGETRLLRVDGKVSPSSPERPYVIGHAVDITADAREAATLREQALHDPLTGCLNRRYLETFDAAVAHDARWAVINIDLDGFKQVNDTHGHEHGDQVLRETAAFLTRRLRDGDALVRVGGDEFLILLRDANQASVDALLARLQGDRPQAPCRYSLGAALRQEDENLEQTLARADASMYERRRAARAPAGLPQGGVGSK